MLIRIWNQRTVANVYTAAWYLVLSICRLCVAINSWVQKEHISYMDKYGT